jgi:hypothetical protein
MEFRWVAAITLWTMLSGPVLTSPGLKQAPRSPAATPHHTVKAVAPLTRTAHR